MFSLIIAQNNLWQKFYFKDILHSLHKMFSVLTVTQLLRYFIILVQWLLFSPLSLCQLDRINFEIYGE